MLMVNTWLHYAADEVGSKEALQFIIDHGADVNAKNKQNRTALMLASKKGNIDGINVLLKAGANQAIVDVDGNTWLHYAAGEFGSKETLQVIIDHGADVNAKNKQNITALMLASWKRNTDGIVLLQVGANQAIVDLYGNTWLHYAASGVGEKEALQVIIDHGADVNAKNKLNHTALMLASGNGNVDVMNMLIKTGADPDIEDANGNTWLHYAMYGDFNKEVLKVIIDYGADVNAKNKENITALMLGSKTGNTDGINVLLQAGANQAIVDDDGNTWLHYAASGVNSKEALQVIIDHGADVNAKNKQNRTALMLASKKGNIDGINVLLKAGANQAIVDVDGNTWLHYAAGGVGSKEALQVIIDHGADVNAKNKQNLTALMLASKTGNTDGINVLLKAGTNRSIVDLYGNTWLLYAAYGFANKLCKS